MVAFASFTLGTAIAMSSVVFLASGCAAGDPWGGQEFSERPPVDASLAVERSASSPASEGTLEQRAQSGAPRAQYQLGMSYYYGIDVPKDRSLAELWIGRAAEQGHREAKQVLASLQRVHATKDRAEPASSEKRQEAKRVAPSAGPAAQITAVGSTVDGSAVAPKGTVWIRAQPATSYTVQLVGARDRARIERFIGTAALRGELAYFRTQHDGGDWYVVVLGSFPDRARAEQAKRFLPKSMLSAGPWVRPFKEIHAIMRD